MRETRRLWRIAGVTLATIFLVSVGSAMLGAQTPAKGRTVWDGIYTDAQAERGVLAFNQSCSNCHTLEETGNRRPVTGEKFWEAWTQKTASDLLTWVSTNMPNGNGGSLPAPTYRDLVAAILKSNGFPAGTTDLAPDTIAGVQIIPKDGPGELPANTLARVVGCLAKNGNDWVLTTATVPQRVDKTGVGPEDATVPLGDRTVPLKFVLTRLDSYMGQRMSVSGILIGAGGRDGINVTTINRVAEACR